MQPRKCPICHKNMAILQYVNTEADLDFEYKGFRCYSCNSTYPHEVLNSLERTLPEDSPDGFVMEIRAPYGYEDWLKPKTCPLCETVLFGVTANSKDHPDVFLFEGFECSSCKSYFDKTVLFKLKDYIDEDDGLNWDAMVVAYEQLVEQQKHIHPTVS